MIERRTQEVFYAPTANKTYVTKRGAAFGEARAMIRRKYPTIQLDQETGESFYWEADLDGAQDIFKRLARRILKHI